MKALQENSTWDMVNLLDEKRTGHCKWVFTAKYKPDGSIERYKAWLVAKGGNLVTWRSKKQKVVSFSSAEAKYGAHHHAMTELIWLKILMKELGFGPEKHMVMYCDNTAAIEIANNPIQHDITKHIEVDRHFIKDNIVNDIITVPHIK
ncbi:unnamed protein product [Prunus armeniaca]